jgi:hypothetical protein
VALRSVALEQQIDYVGVAHVADIKGDQDAPLRKRLEAKGRRPGAALLRSYI